MRDGMSMNFDSVESTTAEIKKQVKLIHNHSEELSETNKVYCDNIKDNICKSVDYYIEKIDEATQRLQDDLEKKINALSKFGRDVNDLETSNPIKANIRI